MTKWHMCSATFHRKHQMCARRVYLCENILSKIVTETKTLPCAAHGLRDETSRCICLLIAVSFFAVIVSAVAAAALMIRFLHGINRAT